MAQLVLLKRPTSFVTCLWALRRWVNIRSMEHLLDLRFMLNYTTIGRQMFLIDNVPAAEITFTLPRSRIPNVHIVYFVSKKDNSPQFAGIVSRDGTRTIDAFNLCNIVWNGPVLKTRHPQNGCFRIPECVQSVKWGLSAL